MRNVIEVYVENLKKYNQGILNGRWITLGIAEESLQKILKEHLGIADYNSAIAIFDYHADFEIDEHENIYHLNQTAKLLNCLLDEDCKKVLDYCKVREITAALEISNVQSLLTSLSTRVYIPQAALPTLVNRWFLFMDIFQIG